MSHHPHLSASTIRRCCQIAVHVEIIRRVAVYLRPYKLMALAPLVARSSLAFAFVYPKLTQFIIDDVIGRNEPIC
jgi:hypothetical protein